jgi:hypothetical protein
VDPKSLEHHPDLYFEEGIVKKTSELNPRHKIAKYYGLEFHIWDEKTIILSGSLHKFWNSWNGRYERFGVQDTDPQMRTGHNWNDFPASALHWVIDHLSAFLDLDPENFILQNIEIGVNLRDPVLNPKTFTESLLLFNWKPWDRMTGRQKNRSIGKECASNNYRMKFYRKGYQCGLPFPVLRNEMHVNRMYHLKDTGVATLADLYDHSRLRALGAVLISSLDNALLFEPGLLAESLKPSEREFLDKAQYPKWWTNLYKKDRDKFNRDRRKYRSICEKYPDACMIPGLRFAIEKKICELVPEDGKTSTILTDIYPNQNSKTSTILTGVTESSKKGKKYHFNTSDNKLKTSPKPPIDQRPAEVLPDRVCRSCRRCLDGRRNDARSCTKDCRNDHSNRRNNLIRRNGREWSLPLFPDLWDSCWPAVAADLNPDHKATETTH